MATYFRMPGVSADSDEAVLESWTVEQGATVSSGQPIASVETEKAVVEVEADVDAIVHTLLVDNGATVPVGDPIAILLGVDEPPSAAEKLLADLGRGGAGRCGGARRPRLGRCVGRGAGRRGDTGDSQALEEAVRSAPEEAGARGGAPAPASGARIDVGAGAAGNGAAGSGGATGGRQFSSPSARRVARELGVDISSLTGSGPKGRVVRDDVLRAAEAAPAPAGPAPPPRPSRRRRPAGRRTGRPRRPRPPRQPARPCPRAGPRSRTTGSARSSRRACRSPSRPHRTSTCAGRPGWTPCWPCERS